jgi:hypothetical protein
VGLAPSPPLSAAPYTRRPSQAEATVNAVHAQADFVAEQRRRSHEISEQLRLSNNRAPPGLRLSPYGTPIDGTPSANGDAYNGGIIDSVPRPSAEAAAEAAHAQQLANSIIARGTSSGAAQQAYPSAAIADLLGDFGSLSDERATRFDIESWIAQQGFGDVRGYTKESGASGGTETAALI